MSVENISITMNHLFSCSNWKQLVVRSFSTGETMATIQVHPQNLTEVRSSSLSFFYCLLSNDRSCTNPEMHNTSWTGISTYSNYI